MVHCPRLTRGKPFLHRCKGEIDEGRIGRWRGFLCQYSAHYVRLLLKRVELFRDCEIDHERRGDVPRMNECALAVVDWFKLFHVQSRLGWKSYDGTSLLWKVPTPSASRNR